MRQYILTHPEMAAVLLTVDTLDELLLRAYADMPEDMADEIQDAQSRLQAILDRFTDEGEKVTA